MPSAAVAEWILSLVAPPDRAASTVGDLVEEASSRGTLWFWSCVLRTAGSHLWHDLTLSPLRMLGLAFWGSWRLGSSACFSGSSYLRVAWYARSFEHFVPLADAAVALGAFLCLGTGVHRRPLLVGWEVARRSAGREMAAAFAVVALFAAFYVVSLYLSAIQVRQIGMPWPGMEHAFAIDLRPSPLRDSRSNPVPSAAQDCVFQGAQNANDVDHRRIAAATKNPKDFLAVPPPDWGIVE